jgi:hypothetical protein
MLCNTILTWELTHSGFQVANTFPAWVSQRQYAAAMAAAKFNSKLSFWSVLYINMATWMQTNCDLQETPTVWLHYLIYFKEQSPSWNATGSQLLKTFPEFYETWKFLTVFTRARHLSLFWARLIQCMPSSHFLKNHLILSSRLRLDLQSGPFPSILPTKIRYAPLLSPYMLHAPPFSFSFT